MLGSEIDIYGSLYSIKQDIIAIGYDQDFDDRESEQELRKRGFNSKVVRIKKHNSNAFYKIKEITKHILELMRG